MTTASAARIASAAGGVSVASSAPTKRTPRIGTAWRSWTKYSWNGTVRPSSRSTSVATGSSVIGRSRSGSPHALVISAVTVVKDAPSDNRAVR